MRKWSLVTLLGLGVIIAYVDRTNLAIALASPQFKEFFALSDTGRAEFQRLFEEAITAVRPTAPLAFQTALSMLRAGRSTKPIGRRVRWRSVRR